MKKLSDEHYIVVDDSEIKEGVLFLMNGHIIRQCEYVDGYMVIDTTQGKHHVSVCKKITRSTQPMGTQIDGVNCWTSELMPLSLSEVKELLGVVDIEKKVLEYNRKKFVSEFNPKKDQFAAGIIVGWKQALEDNKEKKYTEEDMRKAMVLYSAWITGGAPSLRVAETAEQRIEQIIKSLQYKTEWEVEFIDGKLKLKL